jgi:hypothetical protein
MFIFRHPPVMYEGSNDGGSGGGATTDNKVAEAQRKQQAAEDRAREAERKNKQLEDRLTALEGANDSELEKERKRADKAERERDELKGQLTERDTRDRLRTALAKPGEDQKPLDQPHDFDAMLRFVDVESIKSEADAEKAVNDLRSSHGFLFKPADTGGDNTPPPAPQPFGVPVANNGAPVPPAVPVKADGSPDVATGVGMGLLGAIDRFRGARSQQQ